MGHFARSCPSRRQAVSTNLRSRLVFPPDNIHSRVKYPPLTHPSSPPQPVATTMAFVPGQALQRPARNHVNIVATEGVLREANRLRTHAVIISAPQEGYRSNALEVGYALWAQLRIAQHNIRVSRLRPGQFIAVFGAPTERDRAMMQGFMEIGGSAFPITPWRAAGGPTETTWWYHVKVIMENVPREAWNEEGVKLVLGDPCIFDNIDTSPEARETPDLLTSWVWMEDPDELPRSISYSFFAARASQAMQINGLGPVPTRIPATPPIGWEGDSLILVHLASYQD